MPSSVNVAFASFNDALRAAFAMNIGRKLFIIHKSPHWYVTTWDARKRHADGIVLQIEQDAVFDEAWLREEE